MLGPPQQAVGDVQESWLPLSLDVQPQLGIVAAVRQGRFLDYLVEATEAVRVFLDKVPKRLQIGLIAFAGDPAVVAPPTTDHRLVRDALDTLEWQPSFGGTAIGDALAGTHVTSLRPGRARRGHRAHQIPK